MRDWNGSGRCEMGDGLTDVGQREWDREEDGGVECDGRRSRVRESERLRE